MSEYVFEIGSEKYSVVKKGRAQARQVSDLARWLGAYGTAAYRSVEGNVDNMSTLELISGVLGSLDEGALIELFSMVFGCGVEVANEEFDIALLVEGVVALYENQPSIQRLANRFFSVKPSTNTEADSSMPPE